ncbi:hypothetical protein [Lysinibacillus fusiformis]|uniref:hypothetical protein n=1 Tax=Lysinibacillus fusiformis TaxID=28031 RepID=UPI003555DDED
MYKENFEILYEEVYAPKLLPMDLLDNLKLDNYLEVNFQSTKDSIIAFTKCILPNGDTTQFKYTFIDNKLFTLEQFLDTNNTVLIYDRIREISKIMKEIQSSTLISVS